MRKDNLRIFGIEEDLDEDEEVMQAKVIEEVDGVVVKIESDDISIAHRLGRQGECGFAIKKQQQRNAVLRNKN